MDIQPHDPIPQPSSRDLNEPDPHAGWRESLGYDDLLAGHAEFEQRLARLSQAELTVLALMARGLLNKQIAHRCGTAQSTIKSHVTQVLRKLKAHSRTAAAVSYAVYVERLRSRSLAGRPAA